MNSPEVGAPELSRWPVFLDVQLRVTIWPFVIMAPGSLVFLAFYIGKVSSWTPAQAIGLATAFAVLNLLVSWVLVVAWQRWGESRMPGIWGAALGFTLAAAISDVVTYAAMRPTDLTTGYSLPPLVCFSLGRIATLVVLAVVVADIAESIQAYRGMRDVLGVRLAEARAANQLLSEAEARVRVESARCLEDEVLPPLGELLRIGPGLSDEDLARRVDDFIDGGLRPLSRHLHPVSVRLGLAAALRDLGPAVTISADPVVERLDRDGTLLDEDVRLQVYRWARDVVGRLPSASFTMALDGRALVVTAAASGAWELDVVQVLAGLRPAGTDAVSAPLRGQVPPPELLARTPGPSDSARVPKLRIREILTVPLPHRVLMVGVISVGSILTQLAILQWLTLWPAILAAASWTLAALGVTAVIAVLPKPRPTVLGACLVVSGWVLVAVCAAVAFTIVTLWGGTRISVLNAIPLDIFRGLYRFTLPGLALVFAHGLVVRSREALASAQTALAGEHERQLRILEAARSMDRDVAEALHRTVQARLAAVVVMLRLGRREEAWRQLVAAAVSTVPSLLARIEAGDPGRHQLVGDVPPGLEVVESWDVVEVPPRALAADVRRAVSEMCVNAVRHGHARRVWIALAEGVDGYVLTVRDDGSGLAEPQGHGLGARVLDEVAACWGGRWELRDAPEGGCVVTLTVRREEVRLPSATAQHHRHAVALS